MKNQYQHLAEQITYNSVLRHVLVRIFSYAIPCEQAITKICNLDQPILEIGSGRGYWGKLIENAGGDIICIEKENTWNNYFTPTTFERLFFQIREKDCDPTISECIIDDITRVRLEISKIKYWKIPIFENHLQYIKNNPERTLMLCWPPYDTQLAEECLKEYDGNSVIYIGEGYGGCTGNDKFHKILSDEWIEEMVVDIPQWGCIHDKLFIYRRR